MVLTGAWHLSGNLSGGTSRETLLEGGGEGLAQLGGNPGDLPEGDDTDSSVFVPDADPTSGTNPLDDDVDNDVQSDPMLRKVLIHECYMRFDPEEFSILLTMASSCFRTRCSNWCR